MNYIGVIIEESLEDKGFLKEVKVSSTQLEQVVEGHKTPWLKQWTVHTVEIPEIQAERIAKKISHAIDSRHPGSWYVNFLNESFQYVVFRGKVFKVDRGNQEQYKKVRDFGVSLGIPEKQMDIPL